ncbi:MAG: L,D-transpeptidase family protein [Gaiellaceae bacterium]
MRWRCGPRKWSITCPDALAVQLATIAVVTCPSNLANDLATPADAASRQLITVRAATARSTYATTRTSARGDDGCWLPVSGPDTARVGRNGVRVNRREGDGSTPAGLFPIGRPMYGNSPNPGVAFRYVRLRCGDWWVEDSKSPAYNTFQRVGCGRRPPFKVTTPDMSTSPPACAHLAVVEYSMHPVVPGRGSGIFLHVQIGKATSSCISLRRPALLRVLRWLDPDSRPEISIGAGS